MSEIDWTEVDPDLLHLIAKKLGGISNFIRFRAVCRKWRSAARPSDPPPQLPWLLEATSEQFEDTPFFSLRRPNITYKTELDFYSLYSGRTHTLQLPEVYGKRLSGPSKRYVVVEEAPHSDSALAIPPFLLNPLTRTQIPLPLENNLFHRPVYLEPNPVCARGNDVLAVFLLLGGFENARSTITLATWGSNDGWTSVEIPRGSKGLYYKGKFYNSFKCREIMVMDVATGEIISTIPYPKQSWCSDYLIESSGDLLRVLKIYPPFTGDCRFEVYRLKEHDRGKFSWEKLNNLGDLVIFLDLTHGLCLKASDFGGFRGNCIYFMKYWQDEGRHRHAIGRYDMEEGIVEELHADREFHGTWFVPCLY